LETEEVRSDTVLENQHEQAVGGAYGEQVERDRSERNHHRPECDGEQNEGEAEDECEHQWGGVGDGVDVVDVLRGGAADEGVGVGLLERGGDEVVT
jgi:hypothetical protein